MARREKDIETKLSPERVLEVLSDFSDNRAKIWPYLEPSLFEVLEQSPTHAVVKEGSTKPFKVWAKERYEWGPGVVRWKILESEAFQAGTQLEAHITPRAGGGSKVHLVWERTGKSLKGKMIVALIAVLGGKPIFDTYRKVFDAQAKP